MPQIRKLAAIMFTDIVGYTKLMGEDEKKALEVLKINRGIQKSTINKYNGQWLKEMGDGILASFTTASEAVYCGGEIIKECKSKGVDLRIGIHMGEIVEEDGDVFGDGVNVASRLETLAGIGEMVVSGPIHGNVRNKPGITSTFIEEKSLKNVEEPVRIYKVTVEPLAPEAQIDSDSKALRKSKRTLPFIGIAVVTALVFLVLYSLSGLYTWKDETSKETSLVTLEKSIAVLPFKNDSPDEENEYFCNGMMESIIDQLTKMEQLTKVTSRTSVEKYRESTHAIPDIGKELEVNYIIEGSIQRVEDQARVFIQLIEANGDEHIWSRMYERSLTATEIFVMQSEIATDVAKTLNISLSPTEHARIEKIPTQNTEAYDLYLKAQEGWDYQKKIELYNRAIVLDPQFSDAYVGLGDVYWILAHYSSTDVRAYWSESRKNLLRAIQIDSLNGKAYASLAVLLHNYDWDMEAARAALIKGRSLVPNMEDLGSHYRFFLHITGEYDSLGRYLVSLNPDVFDASSPPFETIHYLGMGNYDIAYNKTMREWKAKTGEFNPWNGALSCLAKKDYQNAILMLSDFNWAAFQQIKKAMMAYAYLKSGNIEEAEKLEGELEQVAADGYVPSVHFAIIAMGRDDHEQALMHLNKAIDERTFVLHWTFFLGGIFDPLCSDPRFREIYIKSWNGNAPPKVLAIIDERAGW